MSYELKKPISATEKADFIVNYNHSQGLRIEDTEMFLFALLPNEMMGEKEIEIEVPDYETVTEEYEETTQEPLLDANGEVVLESDIPVIQTTVETKTREVQKPILNENGEQVTHTETITIPYPVS